MVLYHEKKSKTYLFPRVSLMDLYVRHHERRSERGVRTFHVLYDFQSFVSMHELKISMRGQGISYFVAIKS